jgi:hypothetical protein
LVSLRGLLRVAYVPFLIWLRHFQHRKPRKEGLGVLVSEQSPAGHKRLRKGLGSSGEWVNGKGRQRRTSGVVLRPVPG